MGDVGDITRRIHDSLEVIGSERDNPDQILHYEIMAWERIAADVVSRLSRLPQPPYRIVLFDRLFLRVSDGNLRSSDMAGSDPADVGEAIREYGLRELLEALDRSLRLYIIRRAK